MTINSDGETLHLAACGVNRIIPVCLGNFGPVLAGNHIVCIDDANTFIEPESYSRTFGLAYRTLLPLIGKRASRVATVPDAVCSFASVATLSWCPCTTEFARWTALLSGLISGTDYSGYGRPILCC